MGSNNMDALGVILAKVGEKGQARFQCTWRLSDTHAQDASTSWQTVDIKFKVISKSPDFAWPEDPRNVHILNESSPTESCEISEDVFRLPAMFDFLLNCLSAAVLGHGVSVARLIVPRDRGYIARSDIIPLRLLGCSLATHTVSFSEPHQYFAGAPVALESLRQLPTIFSASAAGMMLSWTETHGEDVLQSSLSSLDLELRNRLAFHWLLTEEPKRPTLAIVDGGISGPDNGGTGESIYMAAKALGIDMVVFDTPGHWVNGPRFSHWRKDTVALDTPLKPDVNFSSRIVDAVRSYAGQIDGIITFRDHYKLPVAEAALQLSLATYPPSAYEIATDKFKTSVSVEHQAHCASSAEEAYRIIKDNHLEFPLIMKPTHGFLSEGVFRVEDSTQLEAGVQQINADRHGNEFVIEKYCEGPEVDANFVLCDGEVLFFEASDDFPKTGDVNGCGSVKSFIELANVLPSALPEDELALLKDSLHHSLLQMGFQDGFYHLEARVENSSMEYETVNGVLDLTRRAVPTSGQPSAWLIEVNPRPPGIQAAEAVRHTYGLDYFGLALLFALGDKQRVKQLSRPFAQGAQYWCEMVFIPVEKGGLFDSGNVCEELFSRRPDLEACVSASFCFLRKGDKVNDPSTGVNSWVAYFNVFSRHSRAHLLELSDTIRKEVRFSILSSGNLSRQTSEV